MLTKQQQDFLTMAAQASVVAEKATGLPACLSLSQAIYESGWGSRCPGNNMFGIKPDGGGSGTQYFISKEFLDGSWKTMTEAFEKYDTPEECFEDHARLITTGAPYQKVWEEFKLDGNVERLIMGVGPVYATDPDYTVKILGEARSQTVQTALAQARETMDSQTSTPHQPQTHS